MAPYRANRSGPRGNSEASGGSDALVSGSGDSSGDGSDRIPAGPEHHEAKGAATEVAANSAATVRAVRRSAEAGDGFGSDGFRLSNPLVRVFGIVLVAALGSWWFVFLVARRRRHEDEA